MGTGIRRVGRRALAALRSRAIRSQVGATAVEYALMLALIAMVVLGAVMFLGQSTNDAYSNQLLTDTLGA
jgi:Flp pilus assembly pilin Flp